MNKSTRLPFVAAVLVMLCSAALPVMGRAGTDAPKLAWKGSLKVDGKKGMELTRLARVPIQRAMAIALRQTAGGTIWKAELEVENGFLVYTIQIVTSLKEAKEIVVDAGNSAVLAIEPGDVEELGSAGKNGK